MKKRNFKNVVRNIHLWLGLTTGLVVIIISITGALYIFEEKSGILPKKISDM
jgi:uncharacterized iron-regulated membrane protein